MTDLTSGWTGDRATPQPGRLLIGLYPARYRAAHGDDIAAVFADATEGQPRRVVLRERRDLGTHALRLRLRIGPTDPAGRVLAGAAPVALALAAGWALYHLLPSLQPMVRQLRYPTRGVGVGYAVLEAAFQVVYTVPWLLALGFALLARWRTARIAGVVAALLGVGELFLLYGSAWVMPELAGTALVGALALLAPADLVDVRQWGRWEMTGLALGAGLPLIALGQYGPTVFSGWIGLTGLEPIWLSVVTAAALLARLSDRRPDRLLALGTGLGVLPWLVPVVVGVLAESDSQRGALTVLGACFAALGAAVALAGAVHLVRRARAAEPSDPA
ncbi:hypothetical protein KCMC57_up16290 [Kitasatospora sp. CMC57]|uniref:Uncharacterized protein n=1 Tax=Kitasatospora sp. CMC57 TaxID=3231513 RepID=A0AB33JR74_9ACTN